MGRFGKVLHSDWRLFAGVLVFGIAGGVSVGLDAGGTTSHAVTFGVVGFVLAALLGIFPIGILVLLIGAFRNLFMRVHFARARRRGDVEQLRSGLRGEQWDSDAWRLFLKARTEGETRPTREPGGPTR